MKLLFKLGDKAKVTKGKLAGKVAPIAFIDKKNKRVRLEGLKQAQIKTKKGEAKTIHGTFHISSLEIIKTEKVADAAAE